MRADLSMLQGLEAGHARLGVVGTASRWLVPALVADLRERAPGVRLRVNEGASERLFAEVVDGELAQAVVTEPVNDRRLVVEHLLEEDARRPRRARRLPLPSEPVPLAALASSRSCCRPIRNPLRIEVESVAAVAGTSRSNVPVEVEGIRLIADLVVAGDYASILPETALPPELSNVRTVAIAGLPPRRLAMVDRARRADVARRSGRAREHHARSSPSHEGVQSAVAQKRYRHARSGRHRETDRDGRSMRVTRNRVHDDGREGSNVKLHRASGSGLLVLLVFALLNTHEVGVDFVFDTVRRR